MSKWQRPACCEGIFKGGGASGKSLPQESRQRATLQSLKHPGLGLLGERWVSAGLPAAWGATRAVGPGGGELTWPRDFPPFRVLSSGGFAFEFFSPEEFCHLLYTKGGVAWRG